MNNIFVVFPFGNPDLAPVRRLLKKLSESQKGKKIIFVCEKKNSEAIDGISYYETLKRKRTKYIHIYQKIIGDYLEEIRNSKSFLKKSVEPGDKIVYINISGLASYTDFCKKNVESISFLLELPFKLNPLKPSHVDRPENMKWKLFYKTVNGLLTKFEKAIAKMDWLIVSNEERASMLSDYYGKKCLIVDNIMDMERLNTVKINSGRDKHRMIYNGSISPLREYDKLIEIENSKSDYSITCYGPFRNEEIKNDFMKKSTGSVNFYGGIKKHEEMMKILEEDSFGWGILFYSKKEENHRLCAPLKLYEFLSFGIPVVCTDNPPLKRIVELYDCGIIWNEEENLNDLFDKLESSDYENLKDNSLKAIELLKKESEDNLDNVAKKILS